MTETDTRYCVLPGATPFDSRLINRFDKIREQRGEQYRPRTKHLKTDGNAIYTNRLFLESSPYLLQHAHNPVNWYPWGDEAFETAKTLKRPVFISVGYSTCHWCHVMEEESFEDKEIAKFINSNYIAIKIDREERPDVDSIYMTAVQALAGNGGWPLNVWLTPEKKPFWGGTYFPARDGDRGVQMGFLSILKRINQLFQQKPDQIKLSSDQLSDAIRSSTAGKNDYQLPGRQSVFAAVEHYLAKFDEKNGGITGAPKFPSSLPLKFLLRFYRRTGQPEVLKMVNLTLHKMMTGGLYDQIGGGFHRYSTDSDWLVPHFEKMLYDNALLAQAYLDGYQVTGKAEYKTVVDEILHYVTQDMTSPDGAFYSATDADSLTPAGKMDEGYFFTWTPAELEAELGKKRANIVRSYYNMNGTPNFEGRYIPHKVQSDEEISRQLSLSQDQVNAEIQTAREVLVNARNKRSLPLRDEKILAAWNGLMITAFTRAGFILNQLEYILMATNAADFILSRLYQNKKLYRSYSGGEAKYLGYLEDYAFLIGALLDLFETTNDSCWLKQAIELDEILEESFEDKTNGGFFMTDKDSEALITREKPSYDGATPSGNSIALNNLLRLAKLTGKASYDTRFQLGIRLFLGNTQIHPAAHSEMLNALDFFLDRSIEIVLVAPSGKKERVQPFLDIIRQNFLPNSTVIVIEQGEHFIIPNNNVPLIKDKVALDNRPTAYVCEQGTCHLPTTDLQEFEKRLKIITPYPDENS